MKVKRVLGTETAVEVDRDKPHEPGDFVVADMCVLYQGSPATVPVLGVVVQHRGLIYVLSMMDMRPMRIGPDCTIIGTIAGPLPKELVPLPQRE